MNIYKYLNRRNKKAGFTLIELLVVIAIIGVLAGAVLASLNSARDKADVATVQSQLKQIRIGIQLVLDNEGQYPTGASTTLCDNGTETTLSSGSNLWNYMQYVQDPWGNDYVLDGDYQCGASTVGCEGEDDAGEISGVLQSFGPNGVQNYGDGDDIVLVDCKR